MPLNDVTIRTAKPQDKVYMLTDGEGMYLKVTPKGGKWWRFKYRFDGKQKRLSLGTYPYAIATGRAERDACCKHD